MARSLLALLLGTAGLATAFPLWLDAPPGRVNPHDPKSAAFTPPATPTPLPSSTASPTPTPSFTPPPSDLWDDFERDFVPSPYGGDENPASVLSWDWSADTAVSGTRSWKLNIEITSSASYGPWVILPGSSLHGDTTPFDFTGATKMTFWYKTNRAMWFMPHFMEGNTGGADAESWYGFTNMTVDPLWQKKSLPLTSFSIAGTPGNGIKDVQSVTGIWLEFYWLPAYPPSTVYIDDIRFEP